MLVLSRKKSEKVIIKVGDIVIEIEVVQIRGNRVRIGVTAEADRVAVHRGEIWNLRRDA